MDVSLFDFHLPQSCIAQCPARPRDAARMLHIPKHGDFADLGVRDLPGLLRKGDVMVFNDTRVIPAALNGVRPARSVGGGGPVEVEVNLHKRLDASGWRAFVRPAMMPRIETTAMNAPTARHRLPSMSNIASFQPFTSLLTNAPIRMSPIEKMNVAVLHVISTWLDLQQQQNGSVFRSSASRRARACSVNDGAALVL